MGDRATAAQKEGPALATEEPLHWYERPCSQICGRCLRSHRAGRARQELRSNIPWCELGLKDLAINSSPCALAAWIICFALFCLFLYTLWFSVSLYFLYAEFFYSLTKK